MPVLSGEFLEAAPALKAVFYAAGSVKGFVTDAGWERGIVVSSAWAANGVPVAEYSLAAILLSLKRFWHFSRMTRSGAVRSDDLNLPGAYHTKVGLVSLGAVGRATARLLKPFDLTLLAYDPFLPAGAAEDLNVGLVPLEELFRECDVISLHAPWIPETERMITGRLIASMKEGATLINTSRGAVVAEDEMIEVLTRRPDLSAVLDVTYPEPPAPDSPLRSLPNVILTPHIAGSMQGECARMGSWMAVEFQRYVSGEPLRHAVTRDRLARMA
jgi:phosphoglycerate dehydrogenase-like enzyme